MNKSSCMISLTSCIILCSVVSVVLATREYAQGGQWSRGVGFSYVWSYYLHPTKRHASSVYGKYKADSGPTPPKVDAKASAERSFFYTNRAYYRLIS